MTWRPKRFHVAVIEPVAELHPTDPMFPPIEGWLSLSSPDEFFEIIWSPLDSTPLRHVAAIFQNLEFPTGPWQFGYFLKADCGRISAMSISSIGPAFCITLFHSEQPDLPRTFCLPPACFLELSRFVEQLILNGIAVPHHTPNAPCLLVFYRRTHRATYGDIPPYFEMPFLAVPDLAALWECVQALYLQLVVYLDESNTLPRDIQYPLASAATGAHAVTMEKVYHFIAGLGKWDRITVREWPVLFDDRGRLKDPNIFFTRVFAEGIEPGALKWALPFVLGVYPPDSTAAERDALDKQLAKEYKRLEGQIAVQVGVKRSGKIVSGRPGEQDPTDIIKCTNSKITALFRVIDHDVGRTDRVHPAFKSDTGQGLVVLRTLLRVYCIYNPTVGYLQGMNDLFVPIMLAYFPRWDEATGNPIDDSGRPVKMAPQIPILFWNFEGMLRRINHLPLIADVTGQCQRMAEVVGRILAKASPLLEIWLRRSGIADLGWMYSDFVLLFKRSWPDIWAIWLQLNAAPVPGHWLTYFVAAVVLDNFPKIASLPDPQLSSLMAMFRETPVLTDPARIGRMALWLYEQYPLEPLHEGIDGAAAEEPLEFFTLTD
jgi:hypothetical protein